MRLYFESVFTDQRFMHQNPFASDQALLFVSSMERNEMGGFFKHLSEYNSIFRRYFYTQKLVEKDFLFLYLPVFQNI